jgi:hypothetical protein
MRWIFATKLSYSTTVTCADGHGWPHPAGLYASDLLAGHGSGAAIELEAPQVRVCRYLRSGWHRTAGTNKGRMVGYWSMSRDNVLSFLSMNLARLASSATQLSPIRRQLSSVCALMQAEAPTGKLAGLQPEQSSSAQATPGHHLKRVKRAPCPPWIVNEDSLLQVRDLDRGICVVTGQSNRVRSMSTPRA